MCRPREPSSARSVRDAERAIDELGAPVVIKASGLAAGKGVVVCETAAEARAAAKAMLDDHAFGDAGATILVEEFMDGEELSLFVLTDGQQIVPLPPVQDHKRLLDGDRGPNTGGMGAYCPVSIVERSPELVDDVIVRVVRPTLAAMRAARRAVHGTAVRWPHAHGRRTESCRIQLPVRRPGDAGAPPCAVE